MKAKHKTNSLNFKKKNKVSGQSVDIEIGNKISYQEKIQGKDNRKGEDAQKVKIKNGMDGRVRDKVTGKVKHVVPRLAYYVLVSESCQDPFHFRFLHYLSMRSAARFLRPRAVYVLGNCVPRGYWWSRALTDVTNLRFIRRPRPFVTSDGNVKWIAHLSDVIRLQVLLGKL